MKPINMPPDAPTLMWSTRAIGYTTPAAIADLIDNSIAAKADEIFIEFIPGDNAYVSILDNGNGMCESDLQLAMKYGSGNPLTERESTDLGRFGLGLKTASLSQCRRLTVASKKDNRISAYCWDLDHVMKIAKSWELLQLDDNEINDLPQIDELRTYNEGTLVVWNNLDRMCAGDEDREKGFLNRIQEVEEHISLTFHRYLRGENGLKKLTIYSNGIEVKAQDPFYIGKSDEMPSERIPVKYINALGEDAEDVVTVTPYILPFSDSISQEELDELGGKDGLIKNQGFYIYRNKRLIVAANWFRLTRKTDLSKLCRVRVDMPSSLDELWTIDVKKSMAIPPEIVLRNLRRIVAPIVKAGKRKYTFRATNEKAENSMQVWVPQETRNGIIYSINKEYPIFIELEKQVSDKRKLMVFMRLLEQNIPVNAIHTDFYDDKKYAFEDTDIALKNVIQNIKDLLSDIKPEDRKEAFNEIMSVNPFAEYDIKYEDLGDI